MIAALKAKIQSKIANDKHFAELIKGSGIAFVLRIVGIAAGYLFTLLVTRNLGAEAWGNFALSLVVLQIASVIGRLGMDTALLRFTAEYTARGDVNTLKEIYKKTLTLIVPFSMLTAVLVYTLSPTLANKVFHKPYLTNYFRLISFTTVPFILLWVHSEAIRGLKKIKEYMFLQQVGTFAIAILLVLVGVFFFKSDFLPLISYGISVAFLSILSIFLWHRYLDNLHIRQILFTVSKFNISYYSILRVSIPMLLSSSLALIMGWTDTIMLGMFRSIQEVGVYNVVLRISTVTSITLMAVNTILAPKFAEFWGKGDLKGLAEIAQKSTKLVFLISFPVLFGFLIFPEFILNIFGKEFEAGATALRVLIIGQLINVITGSVGCLLTMTSYERIVFRIWSISAVIVIFTNFVLVPSFGIIGAAFSTLLSYIWSSLAALVVVKRKLNFWNLPFLIRR